MEEQNKVLRWIRTRWTLILGSLFVLGLIISAFWYSCAGFICDIARSNKEIIYSKIGQFSPRIVTVLLLFMIFRILGAVIFDLSLNRVLKMFGKEHRYVSFSRMGRFIWWFTFTLISLSIFIGHLGAILQNLGLIGLGLTFALQKPILNFVGWLTVTVQGTYREGDRIRVGPNIRGDVREIQIMNTVIDGLLDASDTKSDKVITFPNEFVLTMDVENFTKDSNYIMDELKIGITFESNYRKASKLLETIIAAYIKKNKKSYIRQIIRQQEHVDRGLGKLLSQKFISRKEQKELIGFRAEEEALKRDMQELEFLDEEFRPKVRVELSDSAIQLIPQFFTPYDQKKKTRTEIILNFLDAVKSEFDIKLAYPHLQIVQPADANAQSPIPGLQTTLQRAFIEQ